MLGVAGGFYPGVGRGIQTAGAAMDVMNTGRDYWRGKRRENTKGRTMLEQIK